MRSSSLVKFTRDDNDEDYKNHSLTCRVCLFCFTTGPKQPHTCRMCRHSHKLGLTHTAKCDVPAVRSTKCVRTRDDQCLSALTDDNVLTHIEQWRIVTMKRTRLTQMVTHCIKEMREFHVNLACESHKTDCHSLLNMIMTRFNFQPKIRDLPQAIEAFSLQIGDDCPCATH